MPSVLVISAHGAENNRDSIDGGSFGYPNSWKPTFIFYSLQGQTVGAEELGKIAERAKLITPRDHISGYEIQNDTTPFENELSKFQGKHGSNFETYDSIQRHITANVKVDNLYDVLTIRNRKKGTYKNTDVMLSEILIWLNVEGLHYDTIVCSFCRS